MSERASYEEVCERFQETLELYDGVRRLLRRWEYEEHNKLHAEYEELLAYEFEKLGWTVPEWETELDRRVDAELKRLGGRKT